MNVTVVISDQVEIPPINSLNEFREWALSAEFPESGRIDYIKGRIEVDMAADPIFSHGTLKTRLVARLHQFATELPGYILANSIRISSLHGDFSAEPDIVVVSPRRLKSGEVQLIPGKTVDDFVEVEGGPDLVVEVLSDSSVEKDRQRLFEAYSAGGVEEYWIVDGRSELMLEIYHRSESGFELAVTDEAGNVFSQVLQASFRLTKSQDELGHPTYELHSNRDQSAH